MTDRESRDGVTDRCMPVAPEATVRSRPVSETAALAPSPEIGNMPEPVDPGIEYDETVEISFPIEAVEISFSTGAAEAHAAKTLTQQIAALRAENERMERDYFLMGKAHESQEQTIAALRAEIDRCHERLEIDHEWRGDIHSDNDLTRVEIPMDKRKDQIDGIEARDCTIKLQDENLNRLRAENERLKTVADHNTHTAFEAQADNQRLRAALEKIVVLERTNKTGDQAKEIARSALTGEGEK